MTMNITTYDYLVQHLNSLGLRKGCSVVVHSKLISFGYIEGGVASVFKALQDVVGPYGTLVFPTYTLNLNSQDIYNPDSTPSHAVGSLSEYARKAPGVIRSNCPIHGHCAIGPLAKRVILSDSSKSLGPGSSFAIMHNSGFNLLLLGCDVKEGATFVHHIESEVGVPYRVWLNLSRIRQSKDGKLTNMTCRYYGHRANNNYQNNLSNIQKKMEISTDVKIIKTPFARSFFIPLKTLYECTSEILKVNPYALVNKINSNK
jgi:aminoglycoside N3'-acetyltransferase